ncbi:MAG: prepilin-type N-terminal cleavage/methylation domain-containing protein [Candidatus Omnitrophica bacterium]|nr:prepilin-type N-terminal cleavage/methylation domain-containing protein [Candidatus Omnitrophota bacterium]
MNIKNENGFSLIELMMAIAIFAVVVIATGQTYFLFQEYWLNASREVSCQARGRTFLDEVGRTIRNSSGVAVSNTSTTSTMQIATIDGPIAEYVFTIADEAITYDDNISSANDEVMVLNNVVELGDDPVFAREGDRRVNINFRVMDPDTSDNDGYQGSDFSLTTFWRN